ncbi:MAG: DUF2304 domain-containing protein [Kiritimatiellia bacterium]|jgi:hypothetical protein
MNPVDDPHLSADTIVRLTTGWDESYGWRALAGLICVGLLVWVVRAFRRRCPRLLCVFAVCVAVACGLFAACPQATVDWMTGIPYLMRARSFAGVLGAVMLLSTLACVRHGRLRERYAVLWVATGAILIVAAAFPALVALLRVFTGMTYTAAIASMIAAFVLLLLFHFSVVLSKALGNQSRLAQRIAQLEAELDLLRDRDREG